MRYKRAEMRTFHEALKAALDASDASIAEIARRAGVSKEQLYKVLRKPDATTNVEDAVRVAAAFGKSLDDFLASAPGESPAAVSRLYMQLPEPLRRRLLSYAQGLLDAAGSASPPTGEGKE